MQTKILMVVGACLLAAPVSAEQAHPLPTRQAFKLEAETGCYRYSGTAGEFVGRFKAGAYVRVMMANDRIPVMDAPEYKAPGPAFWFGPMPRSGSYTIVFTPAMLIGVPGTVEICGRTTPPA